MFDSLPSWFQFVIMVLTAAALIGGVAGFFKANQGDRVIKLATEEIKFLNQRDERRALEFEGCKKQLEATQTTITLLTDTVTGASMVKEVAELIRAQHEEVIRRLNARTKARKRTR